MCWRLNECSNPQLACVFMNTNVEKMDLFWFSKGDDWKRNILFMSFFNYNRIEENCRFLERTQVELTHKIKWNDNGWLSHRFIFTISSKWIWIAHNNKQMKNKKRPQHFHPPFHISFNTNFISLNTNKIIPVVPLLCSDKTHTFSLVYDSWKSPLKVSIPLENQATRRIS